MTNNVKYIICKGAKLASLGVSTAFIGDVITGHLITDEFIELAKPGQKLVYLAGTMIVSVGCACIISDAIETMLRKGMGFGVKEEFDKYSDNI